MQEKYRTALVTGASSGVGEAFARQLAAGGCGLILVARRAKQLADLADQLRAATAWRSRCSAPTSPRRRNCAGSSSGWPTRASPVDLLVNNAGVFGSIGYLADQAADAEVHKIELNAVAIVRLARAALPGMLARRRGGIVNVSSIAAFVPTPRAATYSAHQGIHHLVQREPERRDRMRSVTVTALCPGPMKTTIHDANPDRPTGADPGPARESDPADVAAAGLAAVAAGRPVCVPGRRWRVIAAASRTLPRPLVRRAFYRLWGSAQQAPKGR